MQSTGEFQLGVLRENEQYPTDTMSLLRMTLASKLWFCHEGEEHRWGKALSNTGWSLRVNLIGTVMKDYSDKRVLRTG